jgi:hypothetical protein
MSYNLRYIFYKVIYNLMRGNIKSNIIITINIFFLEKKGGTVFAEPVLFNQVTHSLVLYITVFAKPVRQKAPKHVSFCLDQCKALNLLCFKNY